MIDWACILPDSGSAAMLDLQQALQQRKQQSLYRCRLTLATPQSVRVRIDGKTYLSFCSNDYLGLANHADIIQAFKDGLDRFGAGSGAAHLITGHSVAHQELEEQLAAFVGRPRALLFSTGYMANLGVMDALLQQQDCTIEDRLNHTSLLDGARLCGARLLRYRHNDMASLKRRLQQVEKYPQRLLATDAVFSMGGDSADLAAMQAAAQSSDSWLLVDDAHGFGVLGHQGRGSCDAQLSQSGIAIADNTILMATLGKACGMAGAFVAASEDVIETLIQSARTYIYTTATPPAQAWATSKALQLVQQADEQRTRLTELITHFRRGAQAHDLPLMPSATPIQPLLVGSAEMAMQWSERLRTKGILITAIRPPTVPQGKARLRITLSAQHTLEDVDQLLDGLST